MTNEKNTSKVQRLEKLIAKHKHEVKRISDTDRHMLSHFHDVTHNILALMQFPVQSLKRGKNKDMTWEKARDAYLENSDLLRNYLRMVESEPAIKEAEMETKIGYLQQQHVPNGYPATTYVVKLREYLEG